MALAVAKEAGVRIGLGSAQDRRGEELRLRAKLETPMPVEDPELFADPANAVLVPRAGRVVKDLR